ncbi:hypothetical protein [Pelagicoccus sp. SDUM812003]|uniref:hypothetical protein n=1 Tax=Pelagicoccus sp. SDUM812003 TaxID=3041267 RepID=UPI00280FA290|nr:hypothetical protein [Pelagicoccus sp. SDUM812003]MDQ8203344.1 hypothetical protein [Pelagicoccus sp. SDUM812003]
MSDSQKWKVWQKEAAKFKEIGSPNMEYLKEHYESFDDFAEIVDLLRQTSLELASNKRWTSKFVFPYGEDSLYEDLDQKAKTNDRRFFGRTGELLYLMLSRSQKKAELLQLLSNHLLLKKNPWNRIARTLQPEEVEESVEPRRGCYLPYRRNDSFDHLAEDWISILKLGMPDYDALPYLVTLSGLHLFLYKLKISKLVIGSADPLRITCEIVAPKKSLVREISNLDYQQNNLISTAAVTAYIEQLEESEEWQLACKSHDPFLECKNLLIDRLKWGEKYEGAADPSSLIRQLKSGASKRHKQHVANIHRVFGREIGLISKRGTNRLRYAPNDDLLKTLVFSNVESRTELSEFLNRIWERYSFLISDKEADKVLSDEEFDKKAFQANARRLEQRLTGLGLVKRLSDGCAYVINPFTQN